LPSSNTWIVRRSGYKVNSRGLHVFAGIFDPTIRAGPAEVVGRHIPFSRFSFSLSQMLTRTLVQWTLLSFFVSAAPTADTTAVCNELKKALGGTKLAFPTDAKYKKENNDYYNYGLKEQGAACIAFPVDAKDVSQIVKILQPKSSVRFAVKSGGHDPNVGHATAKDGVLIAMRECTGTVYDKEKQLAYVKPGGHCSYS
jgi:hypothetical protein